MSNVHLFPVPDATPDEHRVAETLERVIDRLPSEVVVVGIANGKFFYDTSSHEGAVNLLLVGVKKITDLMEQELS